MSEKPLRVAVCDDSLQDAQCLCSLVTENLQQRKQAFSIQTFCSGEEFLQHSSDSFELIFLDIYMSEKNGVEVAKILRTKKISTPIVLVSTSRDFIMESYDIFALYYLIKPVNASTVGSVMDRFFALHPSMQSITLKTGRSQQTVYLSDILYAEAKGKRSLLHLKQGELETSCSLSELAALLPSKSFIKPIRYALINLEEVTGLPAQTIHLSDGSEIPISRKQRESVKEAFAAYQWQKIRKFRVGE